VLHGLISTVVHSTVQYISVQYITVFVNHFGEFAEVGANFDSLIH
jgi:hypothetical protein